MGFGKDGKGVIIHEDVTITLGALASQGGTLINALAIDEDVRILKSIIVATITGLTAGEGNGLLLYMTESDLTIASVEANIELNGPVSRGDPAAEEIASRWVRLVGVTSHVEVNTSHSFDNDKGGPILEVKPRWTFIRRRTSTEGGWNWVVYNNGASITTGAAVQLKAIHYGVWVT